jgi:hypothetical protein
MVQKVEVRLVDDLDGSVASETVTFAIDGADYEIDLSSTHADALRKTVDTYVAAARRVDRGSGARARTARVRGAVTAGNRERNQAVRDWARGQGIDISTRGRLSQELLARYDAEARR